MDPLSALGLASNIVQFVDFSCKLISQTRKVYKSATGLSDDAIVLRDIVTNIRSMLDGLEITSARGTTSAGSLLRSLAFDCRAVADDLLNAISQLANKSPDSKWKSFKTALQLVLRPEQVHQIAGRIAQLQSQVSLQLLTLLSAQQHELIIKLGEIEDNDRRLGMARTDAFKQMKGDVLQAMDSLQQERSLQDASIEAHLQKVSAVQECAQQDITALSRRMTELQGALKALAKETQDISVEQTVLDSLAFPGVHQRVDQVSTAHPDTFGWIFDTEFSVCPKSTQTFAEWLRSDDGLCWIAGKPGSGKSTLMKRILKDDRTQQELLKWAESTNHDLRTGSYFFWIAGTPLQKSQEGLLRSLLYDVFKQGPTVISSVCNKTRLTSSNPYQSHREPWTVAELFDTFTALADQKDLNKKYCFFIDGLDEYSAPGEGDYDDAVRVLRRFSNASNFKFCISSREENVFRDEYLTVNHLILQQLTARDIKKYVHTLLNESKHFQRLSGEDRAYLELEDQIVRRAQGVFLWVALVVRTLGDGMRNSDTIEDLQRELIRMPDTLEGFFKRMIESIESRYRVSAAKMLQVTAQAIDTLQLLTYYYLDVEYTGKQRLPNWPSLSNDDGKRYNEDARRRLTARCKGLLEVVPNTTTLPSRCFYFKYSVEYLHRTVRDYLFETTEMQKFFAELLPNGYVAQRELCKCFLHLMVEIPLCHCGCDAKSGRGIPSDLPGSYHKPFEKVLFSFLGYAVHVWKAQRDPQIGLLRQAERVVLRRPEQWRRSKPTAFVGLAAHYGLTEYVRVRIEEDPRLLHGKSRPLLEYSLLPILDEIEKWHDVPSDDKFDRRPSLYPDTMEQLLAAGALVERRTWLRLLRALHECARNAVPRAKFVAILALLVQYGANLSEEVVVAHTIERVQRVPVTPSDQIGKEVRKDELRTATEIIQALFLPAEVETILRHRPVEKTGSMWSWFDT